MNQIDQRSAAFTAAPGGCAFLMRIEFAGLSVAEAANPVMSLYLLGRALSDVTVWRVDHAPAVARSWDGVHLTLGGLLTAEQVDVEGPGRADSAPRLGRGANRLVAVEVR